MAVDNLVSFKSGDLQLEGILRLNKGERGAVLIHPHPLMGGSMRDHVLMIVMTAFLENEYSVLRFNFRGVGKSEGAFDQGRGEQDDLVAAAGYLREMGKGKITMAGYSFGAWIESLVLAREASDDAILISPPIGETRFDSSAIRGKIGMIVCGDRDPFCPASEALKLAEQAGCTIKIIEGADHFWFGREMELLGAFREYMGDAK